MRSVGLLAAVVMVGACAGANGTEGPSGGGEEDGLAATMEVKVAPSSVRFILHVTNTTDRPMELTFPTSQRYDFVVQPAGGEPVWRWSDGMAFLQAISHATLGAGESWDMEAAWDPGDRSGSFVVTGVLTARDREVRQQAAFELP